MPDMKKKDALAPVGKRTKHGLYSWVNSRKLPHGRAFQKVRIELSHLGEELVQAHGGPAITPDARILCDSTIEGIGVQKLLGLYLRKYGVIDSQSAKRGRLELTPILSRNWIAYANLVRVNIMALKELDKVCRQPDRGDIDALVAEFSVVKEDEASAVDAAPVDDKEVVS